MQTSTAMLAFEADRSTYCSTRTIAWYAYMLAPLIEAFGERELSQIGADALRRLVAAQRPRLKDNQIAMLVRGWKTFFRWCVREGLVTTDPSAGLKGPRIDWPAKALTLAETSRLLDCVDHGGWPNDARDRLIVYLLLDTALRAEELCALRAEDCNLAEGILQVAHGKGGKSRLVAIRPATEALLRWHLGARTSGPVLESRSGRALNPNSLRLSLVRVGKRCNLALHPHLLRHTAATLFLENGGDGFLLQEILGHSSIAMTEKYVKLAKQRAALASHAKYSPIERLRKM